jgi:phosphoribosylanthranilate isomerase
MFPPTTHCGVKICGITTAEQLLAVEAAGADAIGLNFWPCSKRYVSVDQVAKWGISQMSACGVAVTVNANAEALKALAALPLVQVLQLHGDEPPKQVEAVMHLGLPVIKALQVRDAGSLQQIANYPCELFLLDSYNPGLYGGEGKTFPWQLVHRAKELYPDKRFILAGGLTPSNVAEAIGGVQPAAVDVASGVESSPAVKDLSLVQAFIHAARAAKSRC